MNINKFSDTFYLSGVEVLYRIGKSAIVILIVIAMIKIIHYIMDRIFNEKSNFSDKYFDKMRLKTLQSLFKSFVTYTLAIITIIYLLGIWFGTVGVTFAGLGGVALGLGAQSMIKDIISGFFIIVEDKFKISDYVKIGSNEGYVQEIGIRTTTLKDVDGHLHLIPNGSIDVIINLTRGDSRFKVEFLIDANESLNKVEKISSEVCESFSNQFTKLAEKPYYKGIVGTTNNSYLIRIQGRANYEYYFDYENELRGRLLEAFQRENIKLGNSGLITNKM